MQNVLKLGCVLMASGTASRFGKNKLEAEFCGTTLFCSALKSIPKDAFNEVIVVVSNEAHEALAKDFGFCTIINTAPSLGQSHTISLSVKVLFKMDALMFMVADQPLLTQKTICALISFYKKNQSSIVAPSYMGRRGNPCIFPKEFFTSLLELKGDVGGNEVIKANENRLKLYEIKDARELIDVDTPEALSLLEALKD